MSDMTWGLPGSQSRTAQSDASRQGKSRIPPKVAAAAHSGIVRLHLAGLCLWVGIAAVFAAVAASGRDVPSVVFIACLGAAVGHTLFLGLHALFASVASRRKAAEAAAAAGTGDADESAPGSPSIRAR
jgi:hypothetical protein